LSYCVLPELTKLLLRGGPWACDTISVSEGKETDYVVDNGKISYLRVDPATDCE